jgi:hypothetical protein
MEKLDAINSLLPNAQFSHNGDGIIWEDERQQPTENEIDTEVIRLQAEFDALAYARARKAEYDVLNQFELISDDSANNTTTHVDAIAAIKLKHPKS